MSHEWHKGVLISSSWHGLESVEALPDADTMIARGLNTGAWPASVDLAAIRTADGLDVPGRAVVASYRDGTRKALAAVGDRYRALDPRTWQDTIRAAVAAGAKPAGAFSLRGGGRILATFEIPGGAGDGSIRNHLHLVDSLDGSLAYLAGGSSVRVVCANTLRAAMGGDRAKHAAARGYATIRHTASIKDRAEALQGAIAAHVEEGTAVASLYAASKARKVTRAESAAIFDALFPAATEEERKNQPATATRKDNARTEAVRSMARPENAEGASLATLWNGATWAIDRTAEGAPKRPRSGDALDSLLFGARAARVAQIQTLIEVVLKDGTIAAVEAHEAAAMGVDHAQIGRSMLGAML